MSDDVVDDLKQVRISKVTLGLILGVVTFSAVITWNAASVSNRITGLERSVAVIEQNTGTDSAVLARLDAIEEGIDTNAESLERLRLARVEDSRNFASAVMVQVIAGDLEGLSQKIDGLTTLATANAIDVEVLADSFSNEVGEVTQRIEEIGWELGDLWWRTDLSERACRTRKWCDEWYDDNN